MIKRSPRLYKYLRSIFMLPVPRTLQSPLPDIPSECGIVKSVLEFSKIKSCHLKHLILDLMEEKQLEGVKICATVHERSSIKKSALNTLVSDGTND